MLKVFNVKVRLEDLFSRCRACNTDGFTSFTKEQAKYLWSRHNKSLLVSQAQARADEARHLSERAWSDLSEKVDLESMCLRSHVKVRIKFENVFDTTIEAVDTYMICNGCGHVYWVFLPFVVYTLFN